MAEKTRALLFDRNKNLDRWIWFDLPDVPLAIIEGTGTSERVFVYRPPDLRDPPETYRYFEAHAIRVPAERNPNEMG